MAAAPPSTFIQSFVAEPRSSLNSSQPQNSPTRLLVFHSGKAMERPTSRMAKTVSVLATAHNMPARMAQTMRWGFSLRSMRTKPVPLRATGTVQRATKTPATMPSEMMKGEKPIVTSLVGASAAPSHAPAASPHITPSWCRERGEWAWAGVLVFMGSGEDQQQSESGGEDGDGHPEVHVGEDGVQRGAFHSGLPPGEILSGQVIRFLRAAQGGARRTTCGRRVP